MTIAQSSQSRLPLRSSSAALLIGVSRYDHESLRPLPGVTNNLEGLHEVLTEPGHGGFAPERCAMLPDPGSADDIAEALAALAEDAADTVLIYYAGHGLLDFENKLVLTTTASVPGNPLHKGVRFADIEAIMRSLDLDRVEHRVLILDCCFSGQALPTMAVEEAPMGARVSPDRLAGLAKIDGVFVFTATAATAMALAPEGARYTAFTDALLTVLNEGVDSRNEFLSLGRVYREVDAALDRARLPRPRQASQNHTSWLALTRNRQAGPREQIETAPGTDRPGLALAGVLAGAGGGVTYAVVHSPVVAVVLAVVSFAVAWVTRHLLRDS
ncbi:caspase, EACC1-associated type [Actinoplanes friuliensis]|uniref:Peptidase C14 caspase domain-containing protein n=1 Tax=Actinoplanes friuliensis DSM 7358 TaxID=1246995 RepID=U5VXH0_9ACTN|nr:caspase family protein [Actinoplanes friuliensis]AGZ40361.1 hypothetical protein AFR_10360 [Actinoplanes friuliensis DSM 7358]